MLIAVYYCMADYNIWRMTYMEMWDIYDANKEKTGRLMKKNDWQLKDGEYHLTVLGVIERPDGKFLITLFMFATGVVYTIEQIGN